MAQRWIWIVLVKGKAARIFDNMGLSPWCSYGSGFATYKQAKAAKDRERANYLSLARRCDVGGSKIGAEKWMKCAEGIRVARIELPKEVR